MADLNININESISLSEDFGNGDIYKSESINVAERLTINRTEDFSDFLRGYPYVRISHVKLDIIELGSGYEQILDRWGRYKMGFEITFPVNKIAEAKPIEEFYQRNYGKQFYFTCPVDSVGRWVRIVNDSYRLERAHFTTYFAKITLIEEF